MKPTADDRREAAQAELRARNLKHLSEMWPLRNPVKYEDEETLYSHVRIFLEQFWDPPDQRYYDVLASTVLFSYRVKQFDTTPYPFLFGPKGSGKSRALDLLRVLCCNPIMSSSMTPASIYQAINAWHPTLLIDETDKWGIGTKHGPTEQTLAILQVLNAGYRRGAYVLRANRDNGDPTIYDTYGLSVIAGIELLPDTLLDRAIILRMYKNLKDIPLIIDPSDPAITTLQGQLEMYHSIYEMGKSAEGNPQLRNYQVDPEELKQSIGDNRVTELFYPLMAVCPSLEGRQNLLELAKETVQERLLDEQDSELARVLEAVVKTWRDCAKPPEVPVKDIQAEYNRDQDPKEQITARTLGWKLRKLHLPRVHTRTGSNVKVDPKKLERLARRYAPSILLETSQTSQTSQASVKGRDNCDNCDVSPGTSPSGQQPLAPGDPEAES